jgi:regulator of RNase E activity RraB
MKNTKLPAHLAQYIPIGALCRQLFEDKVTEFFDDFDRHMYLRGQAGVGKTYMVLREADKRDIILCHIEGNISRWNMIKKIAVTLYKAGYPSSDMVEGEDFDAEDLPKVVVYCDDVSSMFEGDFVDTLKIALEEESSDKIIYGQSLGAQYKMAEPFEREAIDNFRKKDEVGIVMPLYGRVKFIFTMNHALSCDADVEAAKKAGKSESIINKLEDRAALYSRFSYEDLYMSKNQYWGWIADLILNENILPDATEEDKNEILTWLFDNWEKLKDKSVRMVKQKLWKDMAKAKSRPNFDYKTRWYSLLKQEA